jgi:hypothetical protein
VVLPAGFTLERSGSELLIGHRWFTRSVFFMLFFCVFWDGFLVFWYSSALTEDDVDVMMVIFPLLHVGVGVGLSYYVLASFFNSTYVAVTRGHLIIAHRPLPWPGNRRIATHTLSQLFCKRKLKRSKHSTYYRYEVHALTTDGERHKLVSGLEDEEQALFIEQELEGFLGIVDAPVRGEM